MLKYGPIYTNYLIVGEPLKSATPTTRVKMSKRGHRCQFCAYKEWINANGALARCLIWERTLVISIYYTTDEGHHFCQSRNNIQCPSVSPIESSGRQSPLLSNYPVHHFQITYCDSSIHFCRHIWTVWTLFRFCDISWFLKLPWHRFSF